MRRYVSSCLLLFLMVPAVFGQGTNKRPLEIADLFRLDRLADAQIAPDGKEVVYVLGKTNLDKNRVVNNLWLADFEGMKPPRALTSSEKSDRHPRWSPDGKFLLFESSRSGSSQLWILPRSGGEPRPLTNVATGAHAPEWSRDGKRIAFVSAVYPEYSTKPFAESDPLNKARMEKAEKDPVKVRIGKRLFFRHWDEYVEGKRLHLFVIDVVGKGGEIHATGSPRDVTPGDRDAVPTSSTFSDGADFTFSPDGKHLVFTAVPAKDEAWSTNYDLCRVPVSGGTTAWETLTDNPAADGGPRYSPDGKWLAWRAQSRPGFEADRWQLMVAPADAWDGKQKEAKVSPRSLTSEFTGWVDSFVWLPDSETIYFDTVERGKSWYFVTSLKRKDGNAGLTFLSHHSNYGLTVSKDGNRMAWLRSSLRAPAEVFVATDTGVEWKVRELSKANGKLLAQLNVPEPESVSVLGAGGVPMQMWVLKPPGFDAKKKWPLVYLVHGGPQGAWNDGWSWRWNPSLWAAQGYVVALPNPRGSVGFGQQYVDEISRDWGGKVYDDLMAGLDHLEKQTWIDTKRMAAAGASYGGYMMNWFATHTGKFKTLINHCGVWNLESMYGATEELWFVEWEMGGPPWKKTPDYEKFSPHRFAGNLAKFRTPMLIIHNDLDFRVPIGEGLQVFTTLQRLGIASRYVNFPDEGHWVLKPANSRRWHEEVFGWLRKHVAPGGK